MIQMDKSNSFTIAVLILAISTIIAIVLLALLKPGDTSTGTLILGVTIPLITTFLASAIKQTHDAVNSRLTELIKLTATSAHAQGKLDARVEENQRTDEVAKTLKENQ